MHQGHPKLHLSGPLFSGDLDGSGHVLVDRADVGVRSGLGWGFERLGLVRSDVARGEGPIVGRQCVGDAVLIGDRDGRSGFHRVGHR